MSFFRSDEETPEAGPTPPSDVPGAAQEVDEIVEPCARFQGRVLEITSFADSLKVTVAGAEVSPPHWHADSATDFVTPEGSTHPACITTSQGSHAAMNIKVEITQAEGLSGTATLRGTIGSGAPWEGTFPVANGTHDVTVQLAASSTTLRAHRGDIVWRADVPGCGSKMLGRSRLELYRVSRDTPYPFLSRGRPVEALRFLYDNVRVGGIAIPTGDTNADLEVTARITEYLHGSHGLTYDTQQGATFYHSGRSTFDLLSYLTRSNGNIVNCYDQASGVLTLAAIMGMDGFKRFVGVEPGIFGFINETTLVGGIRSNNPFYNASLLDPDSEFVTDPVTEEDYPKRSPFGNHQFYMDRPSEKVFDACAGPALGTQSYLEYMNDTVDTSVRVGRFDSRAAWVAAWTIDDSYRELSTIR